MLALRDSNVPALVVEAARREIRRQGSTQSPPWLPKQFPIRPWRLFRRRDALYQGFYAPVVIKGENVQVYLRNKKKYAKWHEEGISTPKGSNNFIPLTSAGDRHRRGANPSREGLVRGVDYIIAKNGVNVSKRPFVNRSDTQYWAQVGIMVSKVINKALRRS